MEKMLQQIHDAVIVTDIEGMITEWNHGAEKQLGYTAKEAIGRPVYFLYPINENTNFSQRQLIAILIDKGELEFEGIMRKKSGDEIHVHTSLSPLENEKGVITEIVSFTLDITRQKQNEAKLRQQAKLLDQMHDAVIVTDMDGTITQWNSGAEKQFDYKADEVIGRPVYFLYPITENTNFSQGQLISALKKKGQFQYEGVMQKKSGDEIHVHASLSPIENEDNEITGIVSFTLDITQQKENEAKLRQQARLLDQMHDAVIVTDLEGIITQWNKGAEKQFGYTADEVIGRPVYFLYPISENTNFSQRQLINILKEKGDLKFEGIMQKKSGDEIDVHTSLSALEDSEGNITGIISYALDITEQKQAEKTKIENERIERDLDIARHIQQNLLPSEPLTIDDFQIAGWNQPADQTGGDYFDWLKLPDGKISLSIADVSGHGIGPALIVAVCRAYFRASTRIEFDLSKVMAQVNDLISEDLSAGRFITSAIGILDTTKAKMNFYSAGQAPIFFYDAQNDEVIQWGALDPPLGIMKNSVTSPAIDVDFKPGDCLVLVTDGFYEWANINGERFGIERLKNSIKGFQHLDPYTMIKNIFDEVVNFSGGSQQMDDVTAVVVKRNK